MPTSLPANVFPIIAVGGDLAPKADRDDALAKRSDGTRVLVSHSELPDPAERRLVLLREPTSPRATAFRLLRERLVAAADPRRIVVTSAVAGEGKSTCAINLALAIAEEARVLLLDANRARACLADVFGIESLPSVLSGAAIHAYPVVEIANSRLCLAGLHEPDASRLERALLSIALSDLGGAYDYIVIDADAVLEGSDVNLLSSMTDGALIVVRAGHSTKRDVRRAIRQLGSATVLGSVLMDA